MANGPRTRTASATTLLAVVVVIAALYFARAVLIPLALAVLLAFLLAPLVTRLHRLGLARIPSTFTVVLSSFLFIAVIGTVMTSQLTDLAKKLPVYEQNVRQKVKSIRDSGGGIVGRINRVVRNLSEELTPQTPAKTQPGEEKPVPVEIRRTTFAPLEAIRTILGSILNVFLTTAIVIVFVIFILIQREDLRDRLLRLLGSGRINITTQALDEAAYRVSRYLLALLGVNIVFGLIVGLGLYLIGVPNPLLWGLMAALMRYVPYLGIWVAAAMPAAVAFAVEPGWLQVAFVFTLYFGVDLLIYNFVEPHLYGTSTGISPIAILVAAVFWTWLWGPVGLLLATPLTVCLVVLGRYVPSLEFLSVILSDEPVLPPETRFYQRLLAMDAEDAGEVAEAYLKDKPIEDVFDGLIVPALILAEEDRHHGKLDERRAQFVLKTTAAVVEELSKKTDAASEHSASGMPDVTETEQVKAIQLEQEPAILCVPARDNADEIACQMLAHLLKKRGFNAQVLPSASLAGEAVEEVARIRARMVCVLAVPPLGYMHVRYLCRRLKGEFPELKIIAGILTESDLDEIKQRRPAIEADELACNLKEALAQLTAHAPVAEENHPAPVFVGST